MHSQAQRPIHPYIRLMRLDKPIGIWLLMWPCFWGVALASDGQFPPSLALLFSLGAVLMRSAGCVVNDITDRQFDGMVERTKQRPLVSGEVSVKEAMMLTCTLVGISFLLVLLIAPILIPYAAASLLLVISYPFMKRITWWPQAFLGLTFNIGILFGWISIAGELSLTPFLLYAAGICWTIGYDTIYAHQDIEDDLKIGVKSTAIRFGTYSKQMIGLFYIGMMMFLALTIWHMGHPPSHWLFLLPIALHLLWQYHRLTITNPTLCLKLFKSNQWVGAIIAMIMVILSHF